METRGLKLIGTGLFSKVYRLDEKRVLIDSVCFVKEALSLKWHNSVGVFPELDRIDQRKYTCEYYPKVKSLKTELSSEHWEIYKNLRSLSIPFQQNKYDAYFKWRVEFKKVKNAKYRRALLNMLDCLTNYGSDIFFEISPRNVAVKNGKLILLDVFCFISQIKEVQENKSKKYAY